MMIIIKINIISKTVYNNIQNVLTVVVVLFLQI